MGKLISIDNGGTLTDVVVLDGAVVHHTKTLTTPYDLTKCFVEGLRKVSEAIYGEPNLAELLRSTEHIRYSTTQGTNALVQRKGPRLGLVVSPSRPVGSFVERDHTRQLFATLVGERTATVDPALDDEAFGRAVVAAVNHLGSAGANRIVVCFDGPDRTATEARFKRTALRRYPRHLLGALPMLFSHEIADDADDGRRAWTALFNAFLHPAMESFLYGAETILRDERAREPLLIFRNDGDSCRVAKTRALKTYSSGPRGGMEGARALARGYHLDRVVSLDVGGTSTDIGVVEHGVIRARRRGEVEGVETSFALSDVRSIGAGGGSIFRVANGGLSLGPDSVGALPGPACFGRGGQEATITDALLLTGLLDPASYFGGGLALDAARARAAVTVKVAGPLGLAIEEAVLAMEDAFTTKVAAAVRDFAGVSGASTLAAFGGGGPMSACGVAEKAGIETVLVPGLAAVFSAFGIGFSDIAHEYERTLVLPAITEVRAAVAELEERARRDMFAEGFDISECEIEVRFAWTDGETGHEVVLDRHVLELPVGVDPAGATVTLRVVRRLPHARLATGAVVTPQPARPTGERRVLVRARGWSAVPVYGLGEQAPGATAAGPCILEDPFFTALIPAEWTLAVTGNRDVWLTRR